MCENIQTLSFNFLDPTPRLLSNQEVGRLSNSLSFDYFIQGSVALSDNRRFVDRKQNALLFLEVFDPKGNLIASVNYSVEGRALTEADLLRRTCESIVLKLDGKEKPFWEDTYKRILGD